MSLIVTSVLVAGGVLLGRWIARGVRKKDVEPGEAETEKDDAPKDEPVPEPKKPSRIAVTEAHDPFEGLPCTLGDVVMRGGEEAWLAGGLVFVEDHPVSALFVAPEAGTDRAIYARARPSRELFWMSPIAAGELLVGPEPPTSLEHAMIRYDRVRRLPVHVRRAGSGAPDVGESVVLAEYASAAFERLVVVTGAGAARAWQGTALEEGMYDVLPSGKSTL